VYLRRVAASLSLCTSPHRYQDSAGSIHRPRSVRERTDLPYPAPPLPGGRRANNPRTYYNGRFVPLKTMPWIPSPTFAEATCIQVGSRCERTHSGPSAIVGGTANDGRGQRRILIITIRHSNFVLISHFLNSFRPVRLLTDFPIHRVWSET